MYLKHHNELHHYKFKPLVWYYTIISYLLVPFIILSKLVRLQMLQVILDTPWVDTYLIMGMMKCEKNNESQNWRNIVCLFLWITCLYIFVCIFTHVHIYVYIFLILCLSIKHFPFFKKSKTIKQKKKLVLLKEYWEVKGHWVLWIKKGPHTKHDKLRGGLHGGLTNSETEHNHKGWSEHQNF